jgi:hypothetical protein
MTAMHLQTPAVVSYIISFFDPCRQLRDISADVLNLADLLKEEHHWWPV